MEVQPSVDPGGLRRWQATSPVAAVAADALGAWSPSNDYPIPTRAKRGMLIVPFGAGAENGTFVLKLYGAKLTIPAVDNLSLRDQNTFVIPGLLYTITCTLAAVTLLGTAGCHVGAADQFCKTVSTVKSTLATALETAYGKAEDDLNLIDVGSKDVAAVLIPDCFNFHYILPDFSSLTNATAVNLLYSNEM